MPGSSKLIAPGYNAPVTKGEARVLANKVKKAAFGSQNQFWRDVWYRTFEALEQLHDSLPESPTDEEAARRYEVRKLTSNYRFGGKDV